MVVPSGQSESLSALGIGLLFELGDKGRSCARELVSSSQIQALSPSALAYLGDAVFELFVRSALLLPPQRIHTYHQQVVEQVRAERQIQHLETLMPHLSHAEKGICKRGRNAAPRGPRRLKPAVYQQATGFEALIGYLYLKDRVRLAELLGYIELT